MRRLLPTLLVLGLLGAWAGTSMGQLPPTPTVSLPTGSLPSVPLPAAPPPPQLPTVTTPTLPAPVPPAPPTPAPSTPSLPVEVPTPPVDLPAAVVPTPESAQAPPRPGTHVTTSTGPRSGASSRLATIMNARPSPIWLSGTDEHQAQPAPRATPVATASRARAEAPERPLDISLGTLRTAAEAVPAALYALAALAILLLAVAAMPQPMRTSFAGAALVHHRGTIALAGVAVLVAAIVSFGLLM
jgi:hypothetical protein